MIIRKDYQKILEKIENRNIKSKIDFFCHLPFTKYFTKNQIQKLIYSFNLEKFKRNQIVYKQGDTPKVVYIVN